MTMGNVSHVEENKKDQVKDVHRLSRLGVWLKDFPNGDFVFHNNSNSYLVVEVKSQKHLNMLLIELKKSVPSKLNGSFSEAGMVC